MRLGTRGSRLALIQTELVVDRLRAKATGVAVEVVVIRTRGDHDQRTPPTEGAGWFTSAIQDALLAGKVDAAVHSYKDLPTRRPRGLTIAAIPLREDPRDALVSRGGLGLHKLPPGSVVGTSSPRREAQLRAVRPDVEVRTMGGNVESRLAKVDAGEYDATVLALAGLKRLGLDDRASQVFGYEEMLPAPAQGAIAVECRADDVDTLALLRLVDDALLRPRLVAERSFLAALGAGCSFPAAAYAEQFGSTLKLHALVAQGGRIVRSKVGGPSEAAAGLGRELAAELMRLAGVEPQKEELHG